MLTMCQLFRCSKLFVTLCIALLVPGCSLGTINPENPVQFFEDTNLTMSDAPSLINSSEMLPESVENLQNSTENVPERQLVNQGLPTNSITKRIPLKTIEPCSSGSCSRKSPSKEVQAHQELLRLQLIQKQILVKLKLAAPPNVSIPQSVPAPLEYSQGLNDLGEMFTPPAQKYAEDDFYGRTEQIVVFPSVIEQCGPNSNEEEYCLNMRFKLPKDVQVEEIEHSEVWVYPHPQAINFSAALVATDRTKEKVQVIKGHAEPGGWIRLKTPTTLKYWISRRRHSLQLRVTSRYESNRRDNEQYNQGDGVAVGEYFPIVTDKQKQRPFLIMKMDSQNKRSRTKRDIDCDANTTECCRERLYVDFAQMGWDEWILQPTGFHAHYCKGSCTKIGAVTQAHTSHASILQKLSQKEDGQSDLSPCCTPKRMSAIQLIYSDSDNVIRNKVVPNMVVESCGCL